MNIGWEYERDNGELNKIIISEGIDQKVYAITCPKCGCHRIALIGFGKEAIHGRALNGITEIETSSDEIEVLIFKCNKCKEEVKYGADNAIALLNRFASAIDKELNILIGEAAKLFPDVDITEKGAIVKLLNDHATLLEIIKVRKEGREK
jgi:hypothetical protein